MQTFPVMKMNTLMVLHAREIYTRGMFENFRKVLYEAGQYKVDEICKGKTYFVRRYHPEKHDQWCRVLYRVYIVEEGREPICECVNFEHTDLLCCHTVKVTIFIVMIKAFAASLLNQKKKLLSRSAISLV